MSLGTISIDCGTTTSSMAWVDPRSGEARILKNAEGEEKTPLCVNVGEGEPLVDVCWEDAVAYCASAFWWGNRSDPSLANYDGNYTYDNGPKGEYRQRTLSVESFRQTPSDSIRGVATSGSGAKTPGIPPTWARQLMGRLGQGAETLPACCVAALKLSFPWFCRAACRTLCPAGSRNHFVLLIGGGLYRPGPDLTANCRLFWARVDGFSADSPVTGAGAVERVKL